MLGDSEIVSEVLTFHCQGHVQLPHSICEFVNGSAILSDKDAVINPLDHHDSIRPAVQAGIDVAGSQSQLLKLALGVLVEQLRSS